MHPFVHRIMEFCEQHQLLERGDRVLLAVSGGPDSMALMEVFSQLREIYDLTLWVAHFNHQLRGNESDQDARFVQEEAERHRIPVFIGQEDVLARQRQEGDSLETVARRARYAFLERTADTLLPTKIALGHHQDDLAETLLMRLLRGAGSGGLAGMRPARREQWIRPDRNRPLNWHARHRVWIRPLLETPKADILEFLRETGIPYRHDSMNEDIRFLRGRVRHNLLPLLSKEFNPRIGRVLAQTARILSAEDELLTQLTDAAWRRIFRGKGLDLELFLQEPIAIQRRLLHRWLRDRLDGRTPTFQEVERARKFAEHPHEAGIFLTRVHKLTLLPWEREGYGDPVAPRHRWLLTVVHDGERDFPTTEPVSLRVPGITLNEGVLDAIRAEVVPADALNVRRLPPTEAAFDWDQLNLPLALRPWQPGDRMQPFGMEGTKKVSDILTDAKIPMPKRRRIGVLCERDRILWVVGVRASAHYPVTSATTRILHLRAVRLRP